MVSLRQEPISRKMQMNLPSVCSRTEGQVTPVSVQFRMMLQTGEAPSSSFLFFVFFNLGIVSCVIETRGQASALSFYYVAPNSGQQAQ